MPLGQSQDILQADPGGGVTPRFWHHLNRFRHFTGGSLTLASLNRACRNLVPTFPQRSPPSLLTTAACGGLRSAPDCRPRRVLLHLSYSCASPCGPALLVTQDPFAGARHSGKSILRRHLRVWSLSILQEDRPQRRDLHSIAPDATRSVACWSGRIVARTGLRMMPTSPRSPLTVGSRTGAPV